MQPSTTYTIHEPIDVVAIERAARAAQGAAFAALVKRLFMRTSPAKPAHSHGTRAPA